MSLTLPTLAILPLLRAETRPYHDAVEQNPFNQALRASTVTAEGTASFLTRMYGFLQPYETHLRVHAASFGPGWQLERRYRAPLLLEDLARLGYLATPPLCPAMPPLDTLPQLLGAMYVLEGSTLGGQVIARQLAKAGIEARAYFGGHGDQTGPLWKTFCQQLEEATTAASSGAVVASAIHTFQTLSGWLNQL